MQDTKRVQREKHRIRTSFGSAVFKKTGVVSEDSSVDEPTCICSTISSYNEKKSIPSKKTVSKNNVIVKPVNNKSVTKKSVEQILPEKKTVKKETVKKEVIKKETVPKKTVVKKPVTKECDCSKTTCKKSSCIKEESEEIIDSSCDEYFDEEKYILESTEDDNENTDGENDNDDDNKKIIVERTEIFDQYTLTLNNEVPGKDIIPKLMKYVFPECNINDIKEYQPSENEEFNADIEKREYMGYYGIVKIEDPKLSTEDNKVYKAFSTGFLLQFGLGGVFSKGYMFLSSNKHISIHQIDKEKVNHLRIHTTTKYCVIHGTEKIDDEHNKYDKIEISDFVYDDIKDVYVKFSYHNKMFVNDWKVDPLFDLQDVDGKHSLDHDYPLKFPLINNTLSIFCSSILTREQEVKEPKQTGKSRMAINKKAEELKAFRKTLKK